MEYERENAALVARVANMIHAGVTVTDEDSMQTAAALLRDIKGAQRDADAAEKVVTRPLEAAKKAAIQWFRVTLHTPLMVAERALKDSILEYTREQERKAREEAARAEEAARKERERLARQADREAAKGREERAAELQERAATVVAAPVASAPPKAAGISGRSVWRFEIVDAAALPREFLTPDEAKIGAVVRAMKADTSIPGVRVWEDRTLAARS